MNSCINDSAFAIHSINLIYIPLRLFLNRINLIRDNILPHFYSLIES